MDGQIEQLGRERGRDPYVTADYDDDDDDDDDDDGDDDGDDGD